MASAGEKISMKQTGVKAREFPTRQPGERQFKLLGNEAAVKQPNEGGATYVDVPFEPINLEEGTPNGRVYHSFFLDTANDPQSGAPSYASPNGFAALTQATGDDCEAGVVEQEVVYTENHRKSEKRGKSEVLTILDPAEVIEYLKAHDGTVVTAYEGLKKVSEKDKQAHPNWKDKNFFVRFVIPEAASAPAGNGLPTRRRG